MPTKLIIGIVLTALVLFALRDDPEAMAACEKTHSHDTCFYALNR